MVNPGDHQISGAGHHACGQRHIEGHSAPFEFRAEDRDVVGAPGWPRVPLAEHGNAMLVKSTVLPCHRRSGIKATSSIDRTST